MSDEKPDLTQSWCPQGESLRSARSRVSPDRWHALREEFDAAKPFEHRAATVLLPLTGLTPELFDRGARKGAIDIVLHGAAGHCEAVEVTSTLDQRYERLSRHAEVLAAEVDKRYKGTRSWSLSFRAGWLRGIEDVRRRRDALYQAMADELLLLDTQERDGAQLRSADWINVSTIVGRESGVHAVGWSTETRESPLTHLERLTSYFASSSLIESKLQKLQMHAHALNANRSHLYLLLASTGDAGNLLPWSPGEMSRGVFHAPRGLSDLWLDGGTGEIYHWTVEGGWRFHDSS